MAQGDWELRELQAEDWAAAMELWRSLPGVGLSPSDGEAETAAFLARNPGLSRAAWAGGRLVGTALCGHDGRRGFLYHVCVAVDWRGRGIARRMAEECLAGLKAAGVLRAGLVCLGHNADGLGFWEAAGWDRRGDLVYFSKNP